MSDNATSSGDEQLAKLKALEKEVDAQKARVCELKEAGRNKSDPELADAVKHLKALLVDQKALTKALAKSGQGAAEKLDVDRVALEVLLKRRFFYAPAFEIYGGTKGLFDYGPPGCAVQTQLLHLWRQHFVLNESLLELDCVNITPDIVLQVSGHKEKFLDYMVFDVKTNDPYRADHLLEDAMEALIENPKTTSEQRAEYENVKAQADAFSMEELGAALKKYAVKAPLTKNELSAPQPFNLMFGTQIGPSGKEPGFLRPETAQGMFVNFKRLLDYNNGRLPFGAAQVGKGFRNEISPQQGLLRVREFTLAEIEYFVHPERKNHENFEQVKDVVLTLYPAENQITDHKTVQLSVGDAVSRGIVNNETLGYFMARTHEFFELAGLRMDKVRFRQHLRNEMAHYACDCWDAEVLTTYGWIEVVGHADRSAYDLEQHAKGSKTALHVFERYEEKRVIKAVEPKLSKGLIGKTFRKEAKAVLDFFETLEDIATAESIQSELDASGKYTLSVGGKDFEMTKEMVSLKVVDKTVTGYNYTPNVIEPAFGIGRIIYCILEHAFRSREGDEQRNFLALAPAVAPVKVSILPLVKNEQLTARVAPLRAALLSEGVSVKVDNVSETIGRRYARTDEIGIPMGITIDFTTLKDDTVTLRDRDTMAQIRVPCAEVAKLVARIVARQTSWIEAAKTYPAQTADTC